MDSLWHSLSEVETANQLSTDLEKGLTTLEAELRLKEGTNGLPEGKKDTLFLRILRQFKSPIALVLILAALATLFISHVTDAVVIAVALLVNVIIGVFQEGRAGNAFKKLKESSASFAVVIRDGKKKEVQSRDVVPGDVVVLMLGTKVPADVRLTEAHGLSLQEAQLTGEWVPSEKGENAVHAEAPLAERSSMAYAGSLVSSGTGQGIVVATGTKTEIGAIAKALLTSQESETPLQKDLAKIANLLLFISVITLVVISALALIRGVSLADTMLIAISIAVSSIPEGLPAAVTVVLALGMERILKSGGLVRSLVAAETLGATSVILTDKTGTLTEGSMRVSGVITLSGTTEEVTSEQAKGILRAALLATEGYLEEKDGPSPEGETVVAHGRPVEQAVMLAALRAGMSESEFRGKFPKIDLIPFASERRFGGSLVREGDTHMLYVTGAPELLLSRAVCTKGEACRALVKAEHDVLNEALVRAAREGMRVLAVGERSWREPDLPESEEERDQLLSEVHVLGLLLLSDPIRSEARQAVVSMQEAGARVIMLTGDNPETALWAARLTNIAQEGDTALTGVEIQNLSDEMLLEALRTKSVFARVAPADKMRIARVLEDAGEVVAMTGDGVNDAPALQQASIGVALGSGTDVAKEAADIVLLTDSFSVITVAISEGRRLRDNIKKIFVYMLSTNFSETFLITVALFFGLPLPILPTQILWANLIEGGLMNVALAFEPLYPSAMRRSPKDDENAHVISKNVLKLIIVIGLLTGLLLLSLYLVLLGIELPEGELQTAMFVALSLSSVFGAFSMKSFGTPLWRLNPKGNPFLLISLLVSFLMLGVALFVPQVSLIIKTVPLHGVTLAALAVVGVLNLIIIETVKYLLYIRPEEKRKGREGGEPVY